jgi:hypothetical protein
VPFGHVLTAAALEDDADFDEEAFGTDEDEDLL